MSREEFQDNILLCYEVLLLILPTDCDVCGKKFLVPHALSCPKGGLLLTWHNYAAKEWGALAAQALNASYISYKPRINSRTIQGERNRYGVQRATEGQGSTGQATVPDASRADVSIHGFWKWGTSALFGMQIFNLYAGSYQRQTSVKALVTAEKEKKDKYLQTCMESRRTFTPMVYSVE